MWQDTGLNGDAQRIEQLGWMLFLKIFSDKDKELELLDDSYTSPIPDHFHWVKEKGNWAGDDEGMTGMNCWSLWTDNYFLRCVI